MSYNQPVKINFSNDEIYRVKQAISDIILDLFNRSIVVVFQDKNTDTPILPCAVHSLGNLPERSHLQYQLCIKNERNREDKLVPIMIVVKLSNKIQDTYPLSIRIFYDLLHEYSHVLSIEDVKRIHNSINIDQEDCEYKCAKQIKQWLDINFDNKLAEKLWRFSQLTCFVRHDCHYNKSLVWTLGLQDFKE